MKNILLFLVLMLLTTLGYSQEIIHEMHSPDGSIKFVLMENPDTFIYKVYRNGELLIGESELGISLGSYSTRSHSAVTVNEYSYRGVLEVPFGEEASCADAYNVLAASIQVSGLTIVSEIRLYNEGLAIRYRYAGNENLSVSQDYTTFNISRHQLSGQLLYRNEDEYSEINPCRGSYTAIPPFTCMGSNVSFCFHEANNRAVSSRASIMINSGIVSFTMNTNRSNNLVLPWRYVVWGISPMEITRGKYIVYSLNDRYDGDISWIRPGKVFRCEEFTTEKLKEAIDFAERMNFQHVLLDAGWYGLGKAQEGNRNSNPLKPLPELNMPEITQYAADRGLGIIVYVNLAAWQNYNWKLMMDTYAEWGISGIKMGFMDGKSISGIDLIYSAIEYGMEKHIFFNVHDDFYPTGYQRTLPNLLTTEGIRGNEHQDNTCYHNTLLPFTRFMAGPADYTFCVKSRNITQSMHWKIVANIQTRVNQMAMATIFQSPLQHLFWYGRPPWYNNIPEEETDYYRDLSTTWDQSLMLGGEPGKYVVMARRKGTKWFVAASNNAKARTIIVDMSWLDGDVMGVTTYTDEVVADGFVNRSYNAILQNEMVMDLPANGGVVSIVELDPESMGDTKPGNGDNNNNGDPEDKPIADNGNQNNNPVVDIDNPVVSIEAVKRDPSVENVLDISIYPNPAQHYVYIRGNAGEVDYKLYSQAGSLLVEGSGSKVDILGLPQGVYMLRVSGLGQSRIFKVVKM